MGTATRVGFCGSVTVRMLVAPGGPKAPFIGCPGPAGRSSGAPGTCSQVMPVTENKQFFSRNIRILFRRGAGLSLTTHARVLLCTAHDLRRLRLREIVAAAGIAGRGIHSIATDLAEAGYVPRARRRPDRPPPNPGLPAAAGAVTVLLHCSLPPPTAGLAGAVEVDQAGYFRGAGGVRRQAG